MKDIYFQWKLFYPDFSSTRFFRCKHATSSVLSYKGSQYFF